MVIVSKFILQGYYFIYVIGNYYNLVFKVFLKIYFEIFQEIWFVLDDVKGNFMSVLVQGCFFFWFI